MFNLYENMSHKRGKNILMGRTLTPSLVPAFFPCYSSPSLGIINMLVLHNGDLVRRLKLSCVMIADVFFIIGKPQLGKCCFTRNTQ